MLQDLLYILSALACAAVTLFVSQQGLLRSITICLALGVTFAGLLTKTVDAPTPLIVVAALAIAALLAWLGRVEHTAQDTDQVAATDHQQAQPPEYSGLLHPTVTEALRRRHPAPMATNE